jgi:hypothetical protein
MRDGVWDPLFDARLLVPGDLIELSAGCAVRRYFIFYHYKFLISSQVPADCMINHGPIEIGSVCLPSSLNVHILTFPIFSKR